MTGETATIKPRDESVTGKRRWRADFGDLRFTGETLEIDCTENGDSVTVWRRETFPGDVLVEYTATCHEDSGDESGCAPETVFNPGRGRQTMSDPRYFVVTDIEGVAGIDSFDRTRTSDEQQKAPAMDQLGREVNACVSGIRSVHPDAAVDVWDGHGSGGLRESDVADARYLDDGKPYFDIEEYTALLFVGQHAMAGTVDAPLAHTYSSTDIAYYRLNDTFVGEFGARAFVAGRQGVPTVYLAGDDKAAREAEMFVPDITTTAVKVGQGREAARHLPQDEACEAVREDAARAVSGAERVDPFDSFDPPYELEVRFFDPISDEACRRRFDEDVERTRVDSRTVRLTSDDVTALPV
jgi:D-amino peptidase